MDDTQGRSDMHSSDNLCRHDASDGFLEIDMNDRLLVDLNRWRHRLDSSMPLTRKETSILQHLLFEVIGELSYGKYEDVEMRVERIMTEEERTAFLQVFTTRNPNWKGARVSDVLSELNATDAFCAHVEEFLNDHPNVDASLASTCYRASVYLPGISVDDKERVTQDLIRRVEGK